MPDEASDLIVLLNLISAFSSDTSLPKMEMPKTSDKEDQRDDWESRYRSMEIRHNTL